MVFMLLISPSPVFAAKACKDEAQSLVKFKAFVKEKNLTAKDLDRRLINSSGLNALMDYSARGCEKFVDYLIAYGVDVNFKAQNGMSALILASFEGNFAIAKKLLDAGADINITDEMERSVLDYVFLKGEISKKYIDLAKFFIKKGANLNNIDAIGVSTLSIQATYCHYDAVKVFVESGADVNLINSTGTTALMGTGMKIEDIEKDWQNCFKTAKYLLENGANPNIKSDDGRTALTIAEQSGNNQIIALLKKYSHK